MRRQALVLAAAILAAATPLRAAEIARGRAVAQERQCHSCHGEDGRSGLANIPSLAGMPEQVVVLQMIIMREGLRVVPAMAPFARGLTDEQIEDLGAYFASLPPGPPADRGAADPTLFAAGQALAGRMHCGTCHLSDYRGREQMPRLAGQREDYLRHALTQYRDNQRIGTDTQMSGVVYGLSDADLTALAHFMAQQ